MYGRITFTAIADGAYPFIHAQEAEAQPRLGTIQNKQHNTRYPCPCPYCAHTHTFLLPRQFILLVEYTCLSLENFSIWMDE